MTKDGQIQQQVRTAVKDYVDQLIAHRSGPGKGMAVSSNDLMAAARAARHRAKYEPDTLNQFVQTGIKFIHTTPRTELQPTLRLHGSKLTYNPIKDKPKSKKQHPSSNGKKEKGEQHWLTWRTSPTPTSPPPTAATERPKSRAASPARPTSVATVRPVSQCRAATPAAPRAQTPAARVQTPAVRAQTPAARAQTPAPRVKTPARRPQTPAAHIPTPAPPTPAMSEATLPYHLAPTPYPETEIEDEYVYKTKSLSARPASTMERYNLVEYERAVTPMTERAATPSEFNPYYNNNRTSQQVKSARYHSNQQSGNINPAFEPALKAWVHSANDYERDVAYSLFQALGGKAPDAPNKAARCRPKSAFNTQRKAPVAGVQTTFSAWDAYNNSDGLSLSGQAILQHSSKPRNNYYRCGSRGVKSARQRKVFPPKEYTCESSFFANSMQPFKRDFVINPEWASENKGDVARQFAMMMAPKPPQGVRY